MQFSCTRGAAVATLTAILTLPGSLMAVAQQSAVGPRYSNPHPTTNRYAQQRPPQPQNPYRMAVAFPAGEGAAAPDQTKPQQVALASDQPTADPEESVELIQPNPAAGPHANYPAPASTYSNPGTNGYAASSYGMDDCSMRYNTFAPGGGFYEPGYSGNYDVVGCDYRWFGGVYGLYMERTGDTWQPLAFSTAAAGSGYFPSDSEYVLNRDNVDSDTYGGVEFRGGFTFGGRRGRKSGCECGTRFALEFVYWGLAEDQQTAIATDLTTDGNRLHSMIDYTGLLWDAANGDGARPVNQFYDYAPPTVDYTDDGLGGGPDTFDSVEVRSLTVRNQFSAQNLELNILRMPVMSGGSCGLTTGGRPGASCYCGPRYTLSCLFGVRYLRLDEDFFSRSDFEIFDNVDDSLVGAGFLTHSIDVDNHLTGVQFGCNGVYHLGRGGRWAVHSSWALGVYGNYIEVGNRMNSSGATVTLNDGTTPFDLQYEKDDQVATIGELRFGGSFQCTTNWRLLAGYRLLGISGVALAYEQLPTVYNTPAQVSRVESNGSIFLHGLQLGAEFTY